ncbi:DNA repair protein Rev1 [Danaus plexippus]|uniref:DNA repair protein Rev1 n=1 Tax=Danaus plexippus TaxID=13037 RepID=UPI002AB22373|nr:DNA repair protein Rev1 [Danaus plexippus]
MSRRDERFPDNGFEAWGGYMHAKIAKLEEQFTAGIGKENKLTDIFKGVSIYVNGFTVPSADELKELMAIHGGVYHTYQRSNDFIIASNLPDTKVKKMCLAKVVKPDWITDSIKAKKLLNYKEYLLYRNSRTQSTIKFNQENNKSQIGNVGDTKKMLKETSLLKVCQISLKAEDVVSKNSYTDTNSAECSNLQSADSKSRDNTYKTFNCQPSDSVNKDKYAKTAADPNFISEFYNNSRLHHISQLGACFKQHVNDLRETSDFSFPARESLKHKILALNNENRYSNVCFENGKTIMHIDMDCFFVSVGLRNRPELRGKPVAVTHSKGGQPGSKRSGNDAITESNLYKQRQAKKIGIALDIKDNIDTESAESGYEEESSYGSMSEIASCSYEARDKGIKNGMFMGKALKLCPELRTIPYDFDGYKDVAFKLYNTIANYTLDIEAVSCDEMYVDCTELLKSMNVSVTDFATALRDEIKSITKCPCSTGFGGNRLQARLATKKAKPNGQFFLTADIVNDFMYNIELSDLPGVGYQTSHKLESLGYQICGSLLSLSLINLQQHLGKKTGAQLYEQIRGQDSHPLSFHTVRKSVSAEVNYGIRFENNDQCKEFLKQLSAEVHSRMQQFKVIGKCITLKLMVRAENAPVQTAKFMGHGYCDVIKKSTTLQNATNDVEIITKEVISICKKQNIDPKEMRGIGIQVTKLEPINIKPIKGAINKFLTSKPVPKSEKNISNENIVDIGVKVKVPTTPKKVTTCTTLQKSPILNISKSPKGKRRGRPPKHSKPQISFNPLSRFFQSNTEITVKSEIKTEELSKIVIKEDISKEEKPKPQGLLGLPWDKIRELLRAWFESGQTPKHCDIQLIAGYMRDMVMNKNLEQLYILINFMNRRIREMNDNVWKEAQNFIIDQVQNAMIAVYGKKLFLADG